MEENDCPEEEEHATKAVTSEPQEEFIEPKARPSQPQESAADAGQK
ncbi:MAG: hypothetical protein ABIO87_05360 [Chthoniobacterales bacterium]